jgi:hypothetical protein
MKIALDATSEVGLRAGRLLLGEADLETLGVLGGPVTTGDRRVRRIDEPAGFDVFVSDDPQLERIGEAIGQQIPVVAWVDADDLGELNPRITMLTGANLGTGIARSLLARETTLHQHGAALLAWTEPGSPLRSGEPVTFPDPVGARWGRIRRRVGTVTEVVVPVDDEWAGAVVRLTDAGVTRILGIADQATHLEALALTAGAVAVAGGAYGAGRRRPEDAPGEYLLAALRAGLDVASFTAA